MNHLRKILHFFSKILCTVKKYCIFAVQQNKNNVGTKMRPTQIGLFYCLYIAFSYILGKAAYLFPRGRTSLQIPYGFLFCCSGNWVSRFFFYPINPLIATKWKTQFKTQAQARCLPP